MRINGWTDKLISIDSVLKDRKLRAKDTKQSLGHLFVRKRPTNVVLGETGGFAYK